MYLIGNASLEERQHAAACPACQARIASLSVPLAHFRGAVRNWSEQANSRTRAAGICWTVMEPADHLERLLLPALETPWYRSLWSNLRDFVRPVVPALDITSKPVLVRNIWGQYGRQKKSWMLSVVLQSAVLVLVVTAASTTIEPQRMVRIIPLLAPSELAPEQKPARSPSSGGGGGGDRSALPASKGRLPKPAPRQFTPPQAVVANLDPKLATEATIIAPPDAGLPQVNMALYGDPLARLGPPSNGQGSGGGIGGGTGAGVGNGQGGGFGVGEGGGVNGGVYKVGGGVTAPALVVKVEPEYSEEARKAKYQGTVLLYIEVDPSGRAQNLRILRSLGMGLDEKAMEAVRKWKFKPGYRDGKPVTVVASVEVNFRLL